MEHRHGGDIYAEDLTAEPLDFSASINPLGMPESVRFLERKGRHEEAEDVVRSFEAEVPAEELARIDAEEEAKPEQPTEPEQPSEPEQPEPYCS